MDFIRAFDGYISFYILSKNRYNKCKTNLNVCFTKYENVGKKLYFQVKTILDIPTSTKL